MGQVSVNILRRAYPGLAAVSRRHHIVVEQGLGQCHNDDPIRRLHDIWGPERCRRGVGAAAFAPGDHGVHNGDVLHGTGRGNGNASSLGQ